MKRSANIVSAFFVLAASGSVMGQSLYNSGGFESPRFSAGTLDAQDGGLWSVDPSSATGHSVVTSPTAGASPFGSQMVRLNPAASGTVFSWPDITAGVAARTAGNDVIMTSYKIFLPVAGELATGANGAFGTIAYNAALASMGGIRFRLDTGVALFLMDPDGAGPQTFTNYTSGTTPFAISRGVWHDVGFAVNIANRQLSFLVNGALVTQGFVPALTGLSLGEVDLVSSAIGTIPGTVLVDDYSVSAIFVVPTPGAAALLGLGGLMAARRRRT